MTEPIDLRLQRALRSVAADIQTGDSDSKGDLLIRPLLPKVLMDAIRQSLDRRALREAMRLQRQTWRAPQLRRGAEIRPSRDLLGLCALD